MSWRFEAQGHCAHDDPVACADIERTLMAHLANVLADAQYGVVNSQFAGEYAAGTPGLPEPEVELAIETLSPEAQLAAKDDEIAALRAQLAGRMEQP